MKSAFITKVESRLARVTPLVRNPSRLLAMWRRVIGDVTSAEFKTSRDDVDALVRLLTRDVPDVIIAMRELKIENVRLRRENAALRLGVKDVGDTGCTGDPTVIK